MVTKLFKMMLATGFALTVALAFSSCAPSKAAIRSAATIDEVQGLENKLIWLQAKAQNNNDYVIELTSDEKISGGINSILACEKVGIVACKDKNNITITIKGVEANRTISYGSAGGLSFTTSTLALFIVYPGITLVLDNVTLNGKDANPLTQPLRDNALVEVAGGTLVMNDGSAIINGNNHGGNAGGGVNISYNGTFLMKGGTISSNTSGRQTVYQAGGNENAGKNYMYTDGKIGGGGVYVENGTFIKTDGIIAGNSVEDVKRELITEKRCDTHPNCVELSESVRGETSTKNTHEPVLGLGSQVGFNCNESKGIDTAVGKEMNLQVSVQDGKCTSLPVQQ